MTKLFSIIAVAIIATTVVSCGPSAEEKAKIKEAIDEMIGTKAAVFFNRQMAVIRKVPLSRLSFFRAEEEIYVLAVNDTAIPGIIRLAESLKVKHLAAKNFTVTDTYMDLVSI